jgi:hypothetical protein
MLRIDRPTVGAMSDPISGFLLALDRAVMAVLADVKIEEQIPIAAVRFYVVNNCRDDQLAAPLAAFANRLISEFGFAEPLPDRTVIPVPVGACGSLSISHLGNASPLRGNGFRI